MREMWKRLVLLTVVALVSAVGTTAAQVGPAPKKSSAPESVVFVIDAAAEKFSKAVGDGLGQHLEELRSTLKDAAARVRAALERAQREQSEAANDAYEAVVSNELLRVQTSLQVIANQRQPVLDAQTELTARLEGVRASLTKDEATYSREIKERQAEIAQLSGQLGALAEKHRELIEKGESLPAEADLQVRALADKLRTAEQHARLTERAAQEAAARVTKLRDFDSRLSNAGGEFKLVFDRASSQVGLLGRLADIRRKGVEVAGVVGQLSKVAQQMAAVDSVLEDTSTTLDELLDTPLMGDTSGPLPAAPVVARRSGMEVLKDYLQRNSRVSGQ